MQCASTHPPTTPRTPNQGAPRTPPAHSLHRRTHAGAPPRNGSGAISGAKPKPTRAEGTGQRFNRALGRGAKRRVAVALRTDPDLNAFTDHVLKEAPSGISETHAEIEARLIEQVRADIRATLATVHPGQGVGIVWRVKVLDEPRRNGSRAWRNAVLDRDGHACISCSATSNLHAHHVNPWKDAPHLRYDTANGVTLCADCHADQHEPRLRALIRSNRRPAA